jgi:hypothetical protein
LPLLRLEILPAESPRVDRDRIRLARLVDPDLALVRPVLEVPLVPVPDLDLRPLRQRDPLVPGTILDPFRLEHRPIERRPVKQHRRPKPQRDDCARRHFARSRRPEQERHREARPPSA